MSICELNIFIPTIATTLLFTIRFVDRDMMMRFRGGGVGHKSTREVTDQFLVDCDLMDIRSGQEDLKYGSLSDSDSDEGDKSSDSESMEESFESEDDDDDSETIKEDYGYVDYDSDLEEPGVDLDADDDLEYTNLQGFDSLGAEDGISVDDLVEELGLAEL